MQKQILLLKADGTKEVLTEVPKLPQLQALVGGYVEHVRVLGNAEGEPPVYCSMYIHEEGLLDGLPRNEQATELYQRNVRRAYPGVANPFKVAREAYLERAKQFGTVVIDAGYGGEEYANDPYIAGDAVYFEGYTCEEADEVICAGL